MKKRALLIGINYPGTPNALRGCVNDVVLMNDLLTNKFGFTNPKEKRMLTDQSATTQNILERLEWLVDDAQPGDVLYFHYSGHGSQMIDTDYDLEEEPDGLDEIICPIDLNWRDKVVKDDDFKRIFSKVPDGVNLTVVLDCCHSGEGLRGGLQNPFLPPIVKADTVNLDRTMPMPADIANRGVGLDLSPRPRTLQNVHTIDDQVGILVSGCRSDQTSADTYLGNKYQGAATFMIAHLLSKNNFQMSYKDLIETMNKKMIEFGYTQRPELNCASNLVDKLFLESFK